MMAGFPATGGHAPARRRKTGRPGGWTADKRGTFLAMLRACLNVRRAVDAVGLSASGAYQLKRRDEAFAQDWAEALDEGYQNLELEMLRQSIEGCERTETLRDGVDGPVRQVKVIHSYPHGLALRLMQVHRDEILAFRAAEVRRQDDGSDAVARMQAHMDLVHARLVAAEAEEEAEQEKAAAVGAADQGRALAGGPVEKAGPAMPEDDAGP